MVEPRNPEDGREPSREAQERLARLLAGEGSAADQAWLAEDPAMSARFEELRELEELLRQDAGLEAEVLGELEGTVRSPSAPRTRWGGWIALAAAAAIVAAVVFRPTDDSGGNGAGPPWSPGTGDHLGSTELVAVAPGPEASTVTEFAVRLKTVRAVRQARLEVRPTAESREVLFERAQWTGPDPEGVLRWTPTSEQLRSLPARFVWFVEVTDLGGTVHRQHFECSLR